MVCIDYCSATDWLVVSFIGPSFRFSDTFVDEPVLFEYVY